MWKVFRRHQCGKRHIGIGTLSKRKRTYPNKRTIGGIMGHLFPLQRRNKIDRRKNLTRMWQPAMDFRRFFHTNPYRFENRTECFNLRDRNKERTGIRRRISKASYTKIHHNSCTTIPTRIARLLRWITENYINETVKKGLLISNIKIIVQIILLHKGNGRSVHLFIIDSSRIEIRATYERKFFASTQDVFLLVV